jgi:hypothetical protein
MRNTAILIIGIILEGVGYGLLYSVPPEASFERVVNQAFGGIISTVVGSICVALFFLRQSR